MKKQKSYSRFALMGGVFGMRPVASIVITLLCVSLLLSTGIHLTF